MWPWENIINARDSRNIPVFTWAAQSILAKLCHNSFFKIAQQKLITKHYSKVTCTIFPDISPKYSKQWPYLLAYTLSLLICTLRSDFKGGRKVVLQTQIFFQVGEKWFCKLRFFSGWRPKKKVQNPHFFRSQNYFSATLWSI